MQLLRVASTMSYQGSPYSGPGDEYDFEDDGYDDIEEYRSPEDTLQQPPAEDSDEDTEEASETDAPNNDEPVEIKEQMYQDKLVNLKKQLQQLEDNIHPEFLKRVKRLEHQLHERLRINRIYKDHMYDVVEREYIAEKKAAAKEFEEKKIELRENLLNDFEEKRKLIESERHSMELNGDSIEVKPPMKRILRRRANEPAPAPEKRRKPLATTLTFQLDERDIEADLRAISRSSPPPRHHTPSNHQPRKHLNSNSCDSPIRESGASSGTGSAASGAGGGAAGGAGGEAETRVEDGKLLYERRWFHRGQSVYVEGRDTARFPAHIHAITDEAVRSTSSSGTGSAASGAGGGAAGGAGGEAETRVEDGKLLYERRWFHRGQSVYVEGRDTARFPAHIHAITDEAVRSTSSSGTGSAASGAGGGAAGGAGGEAETRVEDGKLLYERRWFHRGQSVYVEGRDTARFPAHIHAITDEAVRSTSSSGTGSAASGAGGGAAGGAGGEAETRVEDGKLLYERRWFHRGQSVYVEGRDTARFPAHIHAITDEAVRSTSSSGTGSAASGAGGGAAGGAGGEAETRVEDGKLLYERRWFHRGQSVYVEGRDTARFPAHIHAITDEAVRSTSSSGTGSAASGAGGGAAGGAGGEAETRVEDGKLLYERRWFHRGQSVYVEGRDTARFPAHIHAITDEAIWVKKTNLERVRIFVSQLARGKMTLKRRAS